MPTHRPRRLAVLPALVAAALVLGGQPSAPAGQPSEIAVVLPPAGAGWDYQIGGARAPGPQAQVVVRDREEPTAGAYDVCYVNAFQTQPHEARFWRSRRHLLLRRGQRPVVDTNWGETLLDISTARKRRSLAGVVGRWVRGCAAAGAEAVEYDNLDSWTRSQRLLTKRHALAYARRLNAVAHGAGLASAQKNTSELGARGPAAGFDFAIVESCVVWDECDAYVRHYPGRVFAVEYDASSFARGCRDHAGRIQLVLRDRDVTPAGPRDWC